MDIEKVAKDFHELVEKLMLDLQRRAERDENAVREDSQGQIDKGNDGDE